MKLSRTRYLSSSLSGRGAGIPRHFAGICPLAAEPHIEANQPLSEDETNASLRRGCGAALPQKSSNYALGGKFDRRKR